LRSGAAATRLVAVIQLEQQVELRLRCRLPASSAAPQPAARRPVRQWHVGTWARGHVRGGRTISAVHAEALVQLEPSGVSSAGRV
jgi:hypothetical protein